MPYQLNGQSVNNSQGDYLLLGDLNNKERGIRETFVNNQPQQNYYRDQYTTLNYTANGNLYNPSNNNLQNYPQATHWNQKSRKSSSHNLIEPFYLTATDPSQCDCNDPANQPSSGTPGTTPGSTPGTTPGSTPGSTPGTTPGSTPGSTPGNVTPATGNTIPMPDKMLGFYYFIDDCPDAALNIPEGMLSAGNTIFLSFISGGSFEESSFALSKVAQKIKSSKPNMCVMYSVGGQIGSKSEELYNYLSNTDATTIANTVLSWKYADGIDWDLEPPSGGVAAKYGQGTMPDQLAKISSLVKSGGKNVSMAGFGSWIWDSNMGPLNDALIGSNALSKYGIMYYVPAQGQASSALQYFDGWKKGCQMQGCKNGGVTANKLAGGISGNCSVDDAVSAAKTFKGAGVTSVIVWMVKPDNCSNPSGWTANNADLSKWSAVLQQL